MANIGYNPPWITRPSVAFGIPMYESRHIPRGTLILGTDPFPDGGSTLIFKGTGPKYEAVRVPRKYHPEAQQEFAEVWAKITGNVTLRDGDYDDYGWDCVRAHIGNDQYGTPVMADEWMIVTDRDEVYPYTPEGIVDTVWARHPNLPEAM